MTETTVSPRALLNDNVPIKALRLSTRNLISSLLNPVKVIPSDSGLPRDWRGLAHLIGFKAEKIPVLACDTDPTARILYLWQKQDNPPCTINQLQLYLKELDRYDIVDDTVEIIDKDILSYINEPEKINATVTSVLDDSDRDIITRDDICRANEGLGTQKYDAFVVFADEDIDFATELIENMEKQYGLKLCVKERDLVAGLPFEHKAIIELISERCNRLIVIISPAYLKSSVNKFVVDYAQALGIEQGKRKIIPCLYEPCELPKELRHIFMLKYQQYNKLYNFWDRLKDSIKGPSQPPTQLNAARPMSQEIYRYSERLPDLKPVLTNTTTNHAKPKKESVKFGSCSNLSAAESNDTKRSVSVNALNAESVSSDTNPCTTEKTKNGKKKNFLQKIIHPNKNKNKTDKKKTNWLNKFKIPV